MKISQSVGVNLRRVQRISKDESNDDYKGRIA